VLRPPDLRGLIRPRLDASPVAGDGVDFDTVDIIRAWREYEPRRPDETRYFMYQLARRAPDAPDQVFHKAVRFLRVSRVPRYLRQMNSSAGGTVFAHQRKVLAALREQNVLFIQMIAKSAELPLVFAYGVQAVADTAEAARAEADRCYTVLQHLLDGVYQQLEYLPLKVAEAEAIVRSQTQWNHIAMARGRPRPVGADGGSDSWLDGNRTDVENTYNMLEAFIRGMGEREFILSMITLPVSPMEMSRAWRNLAQKLSEVRSEQSGTRSVTAGVGLPLVMTTGQSTGDGTSHSQGATIGDGTSATAGRTDTVGVAHGVTVTDGVSYAEAHGVSVGQSQSLGTSAGVTDTVGTSAAFTEGFATGVAAGESMTASESFGRSAQVGETAQVGQSQALSQSMTATDSVSRGQSVGHSTSVAQGSSVGESSTLTHGVSTGSSLSESLAAARNWSESVTDQINAGMSRMEGFSETRGTTLTQGLTTTNTLTDGISDGAGYNFGGTFNASLLGVGGNLTEGTSEQWGRSAGHSNAFGSTLTGGFNDTVGTSSQQGSSLSRGVSVGASEGGSLTEGVTRGSTVGESVSAANSVSVGRSVQVGSAESVGLSSAVGQSFAQGVGTTQGVSSAQGVSVAEGVSQGAGLAQGASLTQSAQSSASQAVGTSQAQAVSRAVSATDTTSVSQSQTATQAVSQSVGRSATQSVASADSVAQAFMANRATSDAYVTALSRSAQQASSLGAIPSVGVGWSRNTFNEGKRVLGDLLTAQMNRYLEGVESGAFMYQLALVCPTSDALSGAAGLLKSAFWGPGSDTTRLPQPFHVSDQFTPDERRRLLTHAAAFASYRRREPNMDLIEPYAFTSYLTPSEGAAMTHPPAAEGIGLLAIHDSMPVFAMPANRADRDLYLGWVINGERARVTAQRYGLDLDEITHVLVAGTTGSGKTTLLGRLITEAARVTRQVTRIDRVDPARSDRVEIPAGVLVLDWARSFRGLSQTIPAERFNFYSITKPALGRFRFNPLAVPDDDMDPVEWANTVADLFMVAFGLGEFARSIFYEKIADLYGANRLEPFVLRPAAVDADGVVIRPAIVLDPVDPATLPAGAVVTGPNGERAANCFTCPALTRLVTIAHLATLIAADIERNATREGRQLGGNAMQDRLQTVWRRVMAFAPGNPLADLLAGEPDLGAHETVRVDDLIDPDRGLVTVVEADGLDLANRKFILGAVLMAVWRLGQHRGEGCFNHGGQGPGTFLVLEEAHELFGSQGDGENRESATTRVALYESMFRRSRALGLKLVAAVQNPASVPDAILGNVGVIVSHQLATDADKDTMAGLFNWIKGIGQHFREHRYLGEMARGHAIIKVRAHKHFLEAAPVHIAIDPPELPALDDAQMGRRMTQVRARHTRMDRRRP
jgi:hypothetical protein